MCSLFTDLKGIIERSEITETLFDWSSGIADTSSNERAFFLKDSSRFLEIEVEDWFTCEIYLFRFQTTFESLNVPELH
jgi:hypothetical protein